MKALDSRQVDWNDVSGFTLEAIPKLKTDLEALLNLKKVQPVLEIQGYPSRISLYFVPKGSVLPYTSYELLEDQEAEIKRNQVKISDVVARLAEKYDLTASAGITFSDYNKKERRHIVNYERGLGLYTFKPNYKKFKK